MKPYLKHLLFFLFLNLGGLAIGAYLQGNIIENVWYAKLETASWVPPRWTFQVAWLQIMIFYSVYLTILASRRSLKEITTLFAVSWLLTILWNPLFFKLHYTGFALIILVLLVSIIIYFFLKYRVVMRKRSMLLMPFIIWLLIAISLNGYVFLMN